VRPEWELAAKLGDAALLAQRIAAGADVDARDRYGQTALMLTAANGQLDAVRVLIGAGAALDRTAKYGLSALMLAVVGSHEAAARALVAAGANVHLTGSGAPGFAGKKAAELAAERGLAELASYIARLANAT
jgi:ankyrin repeat protein